MKKILFLICVVYKKLKNGLKLQVTRIVKYLFNPQDDDIHIFFTKTCIFAFISIYYKDNPIKNITKYFNL